MTNFTKQKDQMPKRGLNYLNERPKVMPVTERFTNKITSTSYVGLDGFNRADFRKLKKDAKDYRQNNLRKYSRKVKIRGVTHTLYGKDYVKGGEVVKR